MAEQTHIRTGSTVKAMNLYLIPPILAFAGNAFLGVYLFVKNPNSKVTYTFSVLVVLLMGWAFSETMMRSQSDAETALLWGRILYVNTFFLPSAFLALSYVYTGGKKRTWIVASYALGFGFLPLLFSEHFIKTMEEIEYWGYDIQVGSLFTSYVVAYLAIIGAGTFILLQHYIQSSPSERRRLQFMLTGFLISVCLIGVTNLLARVRDLSLPKMGSMFTLVATISFAYGMIKYQLLIVPTREKSRTAMDARCGSLCSLCSAYVEGLCPSCELEETALRESCPIYMCSLDRGVLCTDCNLLFECDIYREYCDQCPFTTDQYGLKMKNSYLLEDENPQIAFEVFRDYVIRGSFGLLISRDYPKKLIQEYQLPDVNILWLSQIEREEISIDPDNLPRLTHTISEFVQKAPISFVLLVGLEYLIVHNGFDRVLKHLHMINDQVMTHKARFLGVVDPRTLDPRELSLLEREMHPVKKDNLFKSPG